MNLPRHFVRRVCSCLLLLGFTLDLLTCCGLLPFSWWVVLSPILILGVLVVGSLIFVLAGAFLVEWRSARRRNRSRKRNTYRLHL